jgi:hypothetical protein
MEAFRLKPVIPAEELWAIYLSRYRIVGVCRRQRHIAWLSHLTITPHIRHLLLITQVTCLFTTARVADSHFIYRRDIHCIATWMISRIRDDRWPWFLFQSLPPGINRVRIRVLSTQVHLISPYNCVSSDPIKMPHESMIVPDR